MKKTADLIDDFKKWYNLFGNWEKNGNEIKESQCFRWIVYGFLQNANRNADEWCMKFDEDMKLAEEIIVKMGGTRGSAQY